MKTRMGFVSNSSSSSFLIYGVYVNNPPEELEGQADTAGLFSSSGDPNYAEGLYIGLSWSSIKDDETGAQFKARVTEELNKLGITESPSTHSASWYDG